MNAVPRKHFRRHPTHFVWLLWIMTLVASCDSQDQPNQQQRPASATQATAEPTRPFQMRLISTGKAAISGSGATEIFKSNKAAVLIVEFESSPQGASVTLDLESVFVSKGTERWSPLIMFHLERSLEGDHLLRDLLGEKTSTVGIEVTVNGSPIPTSSGIFTMPIVLEHGGGACYRIERSGKWQQVFLFPVPALGGESLTIGDQVLKIKKSG